MNTTLRRLLSAQATAGGLSTLIGLNSGELLFAAVGAAVCGFSLFLFSVVLESDAAAGRRGARS